MSIFVNEKKEERARETLRKAGIPITEEAVKELYIKYGGLILDKESEEVADVVAPKRGRPSTK